MGLANILPTHGTADSSGDTCFLTGPLCGLPIRRTLIAPNGKPAPAGLGRNRFGEAERDFAVHLALVNAFHVNWYNNIHLIHGMGMHEAG